MFLQYIHIGTRRYFYFCLSYRDVLSKFFPSSKENNTDENEGYKMNHDSVRINSFQLDDLKLY